MSPYFYVKRIGSGVAPTFRHPTLAKAQAEAERLAHMNPDVSFEILKCIAVSRVTKPTITVFMDGEKEGEF